MNHLINRLKETQLYEYILPLFQLYSVYSWKKRGKTGATPNSVKQEIIKAYATVYSCETFVETGTYMGTTVNAMKNHFSQLYSIELNDSLFSRATKKFESYPKIKIIHGDSGMVLRSLLKDLHKRSLFWLDAHYSGGITSGENQNSPIEMELKTILSHRIKNHIILIDDAWSFTGEGYPTISQIKTLTAKYRNKNAVSVKEGLIIIV